MACYAIGDVQGCVHELQLLLQLVHYDRDVDQLIFVGDLINRGPYSLETLQFIRSLPNVRVTLGNHDLYLLAVGYGAIAEGQSHTLAALLSSSELQDHLSWLRQQPLMITDEHLRLVCVHAGIPPQWSLKQAQSHANTISDLLRGDNCMDFLRHMIGHTPNRWHNELQGHERWRYIVNGLTRLRFCDQAGTLELKTKSSKSIDKPGYRAWFDWPHDYGNYRLAFGHWASLLGECNHPNIYAIDTGCVWGNRLSALKINDNGDAEVISVPSTQSKPKGASAHARKQ